MRAAPVEYRAPRSPAAARAAAAVTNAANELKGGRAVLLAHNRTCTGHLIASAQHATCETLELMLARARGVLRAAMTADRLGELGITGLAASPVDRRRYASPIDHVGHDRADSVTDRVATIRALAMPTTCPHRLVTPGHVFPVEADSDGTLAVGQLPEAAHDLARATGAEGVGIYVDLDEPREVPDDRAEQEQLASSLGVSLVTIRDLIVDRERMSVAVRRVVSAGLPTPAGDLTAIGYRSIRTDADCFAFVHGDPRGSDVLVHVHSRCPVSDVFGGLACACGERLTGALGEMREAGSGIILYSGWGSSAKLGHLFAEPDEPGGVVRPSREREIASMLHDLDVASVTLTSSDPLDIDLLEALGVEVLDYRAVDDGESHGS